MATTYELYRNGSFGSLEKTVTKNVPDGYTTIKIAVSHIQGQDFVLTRVTIHKWVGWDDSHAYLNFPTVKEGWRAFRALCEVLGVMA